VLGRKTYEGLSASYSAMEATAQGDFLAFVRRMNNIPKHVATASPAPLSWNATPIKGDPADAIRALKAQSGGHLVKYGTGELDALLLRHRLVDEYHFLLAPVAVPASVQPLFDGVEGAPELEFRSATPFRSGVVALVYSPPAAAAAQRPR
jgi:dihydrofolate reductase